MKKIIIAIDGYAGTGKSTTARRVAKTLEYTYIDSGAMYRAVTLYFMQQEVSLAQPKAVAQALRDVHISFAYNPQEGLNETFLNGENVENAIRTMAISQKVSEVSKILSVREALVALQQEMGQQKAIVMDGRDIGTKVFPTAELKIFMEADIEVRAKRRQAELIRKGQEVNLEEIKLNLKERDLLDTTREESPLVKADDAIVINSTKYTIKEQVKKVIDLARERMKN